ncbi:pentatricopeptide repeat domain containing protein [Babesia divergens]|uniref:Pentatricopeptide repeat domain containing protein n=1 Tax=Babesia divergens TaxID=32595 RepID=A0AAD9LK86_BABDI|nr:pentatricopeptide repeat domain containing protein [Babesia divergens]
MLKHLGSNCDVPGALSLLSEMKLLGIPLTCEHYNNVLTACRDGKTAEVARYIYLCLKCDGLSPDVNTYMYLIEAHTAAGDLCSAFSLYRKMEKEGMKADLRIFCVLIDGLVSKGHAENAWRLYNYVRSWRLIEPDDQLLTIMIKACIQSEDAEKALSIYDEMLGMGLQPTSGTYEALIDCLSRRRAYAHKCFQLYNVMKSGNLPIGYRTLLHISRACELSGNTRKLKEILKEAHDLGFAIDEDLITTALLTFARNIQISEYPVSHKVNVMRRALQSLDAVWDLSNATTPKVLNAMIVLYESGGYYDYALDMLRYFAKLNMKPDKQTYCIILRIIGTHLRDPGRFFTIWDNVRTLLNPDAKLFHMALDMSICSNSAKRTISIMEEMYTSKVFPTPELTARLYKKARRVPQIHTVISKMINLEKRLTCDRSKKEPATLQSYIEEYKLGCAA